MAEKSPGHRRRNNRPAPKLVDPSKTGRALRQQFTTPDEDTLLGQQLATATRLNGPDVAEDDTPFVRSSRALTFFHDKEVSEFYDIVRGSEAVKLAAELQNERKKKPGRPCEVSFVALQVGLLLTAKDGRGCLMSEVANTLYRRLHPPMLDVLDLTPLPAMPEATRRKHNDAVEYERLEQRMIERRVLRAFQRYLIDVDPAIHPTGRLRTWAELHELDRNLTDEQIERRLDAITVMCNDIVRIPWNMLPAKVRRRHDGSVGIDATPVRVWARGRRADSTDASAEPSAAYYVRTGDHSEDGPDLSPAEQKASRQMVRKRFFAYDLHLMIASDATLDGRGMPSERQYLPALAVAMFMTRPGENPDGAFRRMATNLVAHGWTPGYLAGDGLYANANPSSFHLSARKLGFKLVLPILDDHLGLQTVVNGYKVVEGALYCPSIPQVLIEATRDFRDGKIDAETYAERIKQRDVYTVRLHNDLGGLKASYGCPAYGAKAKVMCANKPASETKPTLISGGTIKVRDRIYPDPATKAPNGQWPEPCSKQTMTLDLADYPDVAKYLQDLQFGTLEHTNTYNALRQSQEGFHGFAKDQGYEKLDAAGLRRVHGLAAHFVMTAVLVAAAGIRKVKAFLATARLDDDGDLYVARRKRKGEHAPTFLPPGSKGTRGDPEYDAQPEAA